MLKENQELQLEIDDLKTQHKNLKLKEMMIRKHLTALNEDVMNWNEDIDKVN